MSLKNVNFAAQTKCMAFSERQVKCAWSHATTVEGFDPDHFRKDACGAWIFWDKYGNTDSMYGWVVDHVVPASLLKEKGCTQEEIDNPANLRALQHENNTSKGDDYPSYTASVTSEEAQNVNTSKYLVVHAKKQETLKKLYNL